jgi:hypothetical protein
MASDINALLAAAMIAVSWFVISRMLARASAPAPVARSIDNRLSGDFPDPAGAINEPLSPHRVSLDQM